MPITNSTIRVRTKSAPITTMILHVSATALTSLYEKYILSSRTITQFDLFLVQCALAESTWSELHCINYEELKALEVDI